MSKTIQCPVCESELSEKTAKFKPVNGEHFKMRCGICHHTWTANARDFYDKQPEPVVDPPVVKA